MNRSLIVLAIALLISLAGCAEATKEQQAGLAKVRIGDTMAQVNEKVGEPDSKQSFDSVGFNGERIHTECWYYGLDRQLCFDKNGKVDTKNDY